RLAQRVLLTVALALAMLDLGLEQQRSAAAAPRRARRRPRLAPQALRRGVGCRPEAGPGAGGGENLHPLDQAGLAGAVGEAPAGGERGVRGAGIGDDDAKPVRRDARHQVAGRRFARQPLANAGRQRLAGLGAVEGDELRKPVDFYDDDGERRAVAARRDEIGDGAVAKLAVGQAGRSVEIGACKQVVLQAPLGVDIDAGDNPIVAVVEAEAALLDEFGAPFQQTFAAPLARQRTGAGAAGGIGEHRRAVGGAHFESGSRGVEGGRLQRRLARTHEAPGPRLRIWARNCSSRAVAEWRSTGAGFGAAAGGSGAASSTSRPPPAAPRQRSTTRRTKPCCAPAASSQSSSRKVSLRGSRSAGNSLKRSRVGSGSPSPNATTSRVPSEGMKSSRLATASVTAERSNSWSRSFAKRIANSVLHCEMMVGSSSPGRWVTRPR